MLLLHLVLNKSTGRSRREAYKHDFILSMLLTGEIEFGDVSSPESPNLDVILQSLSIKSGTVVEKLQTTLGEACSSITAPCFVG